MAGGVEAGDAVDDGGERGPLVLLDERGAAILRTRSADAVRTLWNRIRW